MSPRLEYSGMIMAHCSLNFTGFSHEPRGQCVSLSFPAGSLCGSGTGACYLLPVFDTVFVRRKHRRQGLGMAMLRDFCETFPDDEALGVSCPVSPAMYQVCRQFLLVCPEERGRLWEVEPPGAWGQRINIWLKVQLQPRLPDSHPGNSEEEDVSRHARTSWNDRPRQSVPGDSSKREVQAESRSGHLHVLNVQPQTVRGDPITVFNWNACGFFSDFRRGCVEKSWKTQRMIQTVERRWRMRGWGAATGQACEAQSLMPPDAQDARDAHLGQVQRPAWTPRIWV
ncbi:Protein FAM169B [Plecturocebus cupreus]